MRHAPINVAAAIVRNAQGQVLLAQRTSAQIAPGYWELPGGKIEPGETPLQAAARELAEEVGLDASSLRPWLQYVHHYRTASVRMHFAVADSWSGNAHGREGQRIAWVDPDAPAVGPVLPSNLRVLRSIGLPPILAICDEVGFAAYEEIARAVRAGVRLIALRGPAHPSDQRVVFARRIAAMLAPAGGRAILAGSALEARRAGLEGLHTSAAQLHRLQARPPVTLWITDCHDVTDLENASRLGADAAVLCPVHDSTSCPDRASLGWGGIERMAATARLPVYCAGGLSADDLPRARAAGACGVSTRLSTVVRPAPVQAFGERQREPSTRSVQRHGAAGRA